MLKENETIISKINKILLSLGKFCLSVAVILAAFIGLAFLLVRIVPDFSMTEYRDWIFFGLVAIISIIIRYGFKYRILWWVCIICAFLIRKDIPLIEQYTPDRQQFHAKMQEWKASGKKEIDLKDLTDFEWDKVLVEEYYSDSTSIVCSETPELCNVYIPWLLNKNSWTMAFIRKNKPVYLIRIATDDFDLGRLRSGGACRAAKKEEAKLVVSNNANTSSPFFCQDSNQCIQLMSQYCISYFKISY